MPAFDLASELVGHGLHAVADAQHRHTQLEDSLRRLVGGIFVDAGMAAREDHALEVTIRSVGADPVVGDITGMDFREHMRLAYTSGDQLRDLATEVEDEDFVVFHFNGPIA